MARSIPSPRAAYVLAAAALVVLVAAAPSAVPPSTAPSPTVGSAPPTHGDRTVVLFDGSDWSAFVRADGTESPWAVDGGCARVVPNGGNAISRETFGDFQLHLEFISPAMPGRTGQGRGNSGVYIHGRYELQVLDSWGDEPVGNGCGAIYSIAPPLVNASRPGDAVQTYDIVFRAPRFDADGAVTANAFVTVLHNGIVIHNNLELPHTTPGGVDREMVARGPLLLQDHGDPVRYRNIWVRRLD